MNEIQELVWLALFTLAIAAFVTTVFVVSGRHAKRRDEEVQRIWKSFARAQGLRWKDAEGFWSRSGFEVRGESSGVSVRLHKRVVRTGKHAVVYSRFVGQLSRPVEHKIRVGPRSFVTKLGELIGLHPIVTGDPSFDKRMALRSRAHAAALAIFGPVARERVLGFPREIQIECQGDEARVWWRGAETDPKVLESALATLVAMCAVSR